MSNVHHCQIVCAIKQQESRHHYETRNVCLLYLCLRYLKTY